MYVRARACVCLCVYVFVCARVHECVRGRTCACVCRCVGVGVCVERESERVHPHSTEASCIALCTAGYISTRKRAVFCIKACRTFPVDGRAHKDHPLLAMKDENDLSPSVLVSSSCSCNACLSSGVNKTLIDFEMET